MKYSTKVDNLPSWISSLVLGGLHPNHDNRWPKWVFRAEPTVRSTPKPISKEQHFSGTKIITPPQKFTQLMHTVYVIQGTETKWFTFWCISHEGHWTMEVELATNGLFYGRTSADYEWIWHFQNNHLGVLIWIHQRPITPMYAPWLNTWKCRKKCYHSAKCYIKVSKNRADVVNFGSSYYSWSPFNLANLIPQSYKPKFALIRPVMVLRQKELINTAKTVVSSVECGWRELGNLSF